MVNSPSTSAIVSTVAESVAALRLGKITCQSVLIHFPPSDRDASTNVFKSMADNPASSERYTKGRARMT